MNAHTLNETAFTSGEALSGSMDNKSVIETTLKLKSILKAENPKDNGNIPLSMSYEDFASTTLVNGKEQSMSIPPFSDTAIKAYYTPDNQILMDTIVGGSFNPQLKGMNSNLMEQFTQQIDFPESPLKVGDQFTTVKPMSIPSPAMKQMETNIRTTYVLNKIKAGTAYFTFEQEISLESEQEGFSINAIGSGTGSCEYDINDQYVRYLKSELPMHVTLDMSENMRSIVKLTKISEVKTSIE